MLFIPKGKCPGDRKSNKFDFLSNGHLHGHDLLTVCFGPREDCKKRIHCMKQLFLQKNLKFLIATGLTPEFL